MNYKQSFKLNSLISTWIISLIIFVVALLVRLIGLDFGFPMLTHHDEAFIVDALIDMSKNHTLDSGHYNKPNQIIYMVLFGYLNLISKVIFDKNMGWAYSENPLFFYYQSRLIIAIFGSLIPVIAWHIGKVLKSRAFSYAAAFYFCFYPPYLIHSHYITSDVLITLLSLCVMLTCLVYLSTNKRVWIIAASLLVALNTVEKYPGILSFGLIFFTLLIRFFTGNNHNLNLQIKRFFQELAISFGIVAATIILLVPHLIVKWQQVRDILTLEARNVHLGADGLGWGGNLMYYVQEFIRSAGWFTTLLLFVGIGFAIISKQYNLILLFYGFGYWIALSKLGLHWERWSLPMVISPLLLASFGFSNLWRVFSDKRFPKLVLGVVSALFATLFALNGLVKSVFLSWTDTRVDALEYLYQNVITPENSISEGYTPFFSRTYKTIFDFDYRMPEQIEFVILSSNMYGRYQAEPDRYLAENTYYSNLRSNATLMVEFVPDKYPVTVTDKLMVVKDFVDNLSKGTRSAYRSGPTIQIYKLHE